jgi:NTE family protein
LDGGILSNTPVRELISSHRTFWKKNDDNFGDEYEDGSSADSEGKLTYDKWDNFYKIQKAYNIPDLSLTIVNLHPESEEGDHIPTLYDYDMTRD